MSNDPCSILLSICPAPESMQQGLGQRQSLNHAREWSKEAPQQSKGRNDFVPRQKAYRTEYGSEKACVSSQQSTLQ